MNDMRFKRYRKVLLPLGAYCVAQMLIWFVPGLIQAIVTIGQETFYLVAIAFSCIVVIKQENHHETRRILFSLLGFFSIANFILFLFWIPTVHLNPEINWRLKGNLYEVDPWYLAIYIPPLNFVMAFFVIIVFYLISFFLRRRKVVRV